MTVWELTGNDGKAKHGRTIAQKYSAEAAGQTIPAAWALAALERRRYPHCATLLIERRKWLIHYISCAD
jgi:hypothetical protein